MHLVVGGCLGGRLAGWPPRAGRRGPLGSPPAASRLSRSRHPHTNPDLRRPVQTSRFTIAPIDRAHIQALDLAR